MKELIQHLGLAVSLPDPELNGPESCFIRDPQKTSEQSVEDEEDIKIEDMDLTEVSTETCPEETSDCEIIDIEDDEVEKTFQPQPETAQSQLETTQYQPDIVQPQPEAFQLQPDTVQSQPTAVQQSHPKQAQEAIPNASKMSLTCHFCNKVKSHFVFLKIHLVSSLSNLKFQMKLWNSAYKNHFLVYKILQKIKFLAKIVQLKHLLYLF